MIIIDIRKTPKNQREFLDSGYEFFYFLENSSLQVICISELYKDHFTFWSHSDCNIDFYNDCEEIPKKEKEKILQIYCDFYNVSISDYAFYKGE